VTSAFELEVPGAAPRRLILQMDRGDLGAGGGKVPMERALLEAARAAGVPVPAVVAMGVGDDLGADWLVVERLEGETIPRKILRDAEWAGARRALTAQCAGALAAIHTIDPGAIDGLPTADPLGDPLPFLDALGEARPALELGVRWLDRHRPAAGPRVTVHGDFRFGNFLVGPEGLRGVLDWELAHAGDPAEDIGWLCAPAWRFGGSDQVGGFGSMEELLESYAAAGGEAMDRDRVHWWQVHATVKWAVICSLQASAHLSGSTRSVELAAIGRRVCESEWDLFMLLGVAPGDSAPEPVGKGSPVAPFGRPTAAELVEAVREYLEANVMERSEGGARFEARVARNALAVVERELLLGHEIAAAHAYRLRDLGITDDAALAAAIRAGDFDEGWEPVASALAASARDQLLVANPSYLPAASA
jgi:aminoglycoside phosphotransferase (APT) family kinase protein